MILRLAGLDDTARLGALLAQKVLEEGPGLAILLQGGLGCGKTTLARAFVQALPGGAEAEVASPSFTICNVYPTTPQVFHADLYRAGPSHLPDEAAEALDGGNALLVLEWPECLLPQDMPGDALHIAFDNMGDACDKVRMLKLEAHGPCAARVLAGLAEALPQS